VGSSFLSWCNVVLGHALVLVLEAKLASDDFPSLCNVVGNALVLVLEGNLACTSFP